jgi:hypothetical protein
MRRIATLTLLSFGLAASLAAHASCWTPQEKSIFANDELEGVVTLSFRDAVSCKPVGGAEVTIDGQKFTTSAGGLLRFEAPPNLEDAQLPMEVSAEGYIRLVGTLPFAFSLPLANRILLSPKMANENVRLVLSWGSAPRDLDLHLLGPGFHISYQNMREAPNEARLDRDAMQGFGPETITAKRIRPDGKYQVWVHNYSNDEAFDNKARLVVYINNAVHRVIDLPPTRKRWIRIAEIERGEVRYLVQPSDSQP